MKLVPNEPAIEKQISFNHGVRGSTFKFNSSVFIEFSYEMSSVFEVEMFDYSSESTQEQSSKASEDSFVSNDLLAQLLLFRLHSF